MEKTTTTIISLALLLIMMYGNANAQLTGTKTIPGTYASIKLAIDDLNANGVGTGGVTFDIAPGYTETIPMGGLIIDITANQPTSGNPVVFRRSGAGTNPLIQTDVNGSGVLSGAGFGVRKDAILWLVGTDYITTNNIDFAEQYTGGSQVLKTEYGIVLMRKSSTDGCKHVTITGCTIRMQQSDVQSTCIVSLNRDLAGNTTNPTTTGGRHESISIQGCMLDNSFNGMYFTGYADSAPYDLYDHFYNIGGITGNILTNIGSGLVNSTNNSSTKYGIYCSLQDSVTVSNNTIRVNSESNNSQVYGINLTVGINSSATIDNNDISDTCGGTTQTHSAIYCRLGESGVDNTVNITNNTIHDCTYDGVTSANNYYIYIRNAPYTSNVTGNMIRDNSVGNGTSTATGGINGIYKSLPSNNLYGASFTISNNTIKNNRRNQSTPGTGEFFCINMEGPNYNTEISNNVIDSIFNPTGDGALGGIFSVNEADGKINIHGNTISGLFKESTDETSLCGIQHIGDTDTIEIYDNNIFNIYNTTGDCDVFGIYSRGDQTGGYESIYDNNIHDIVGTGIRHVVGVYIQAEATNNAAIKNITGNSIYNIMNDSTGQTGGIQLSGPSMANISANRIHNIINRIGSSTAFGVYFEGSNSSNGNIYNNMISEIYAPAQNTPLGVLGLIIEGCDTVNLSYNTIYLDSSSIGANSGNFALYIGGSSNATLKNNIVVNKFTPTGSGQTIAIYKEAGVTYNAASNNNNIFVPAGASNFYYFDGSNFHSTFAGFQTAVSPAGTNSFSENSPFMNVSTHPYDLDMDSTQSTLCEGGAVPIPGITTDIHGTTRNPSTPDVGADEFDQVITNIEPTSSPTVYELYQNYPNPFNPSTKIKFDIPKAGFVSLKIYDITGREVSTLVNSELATGRYEFEWNGAQFASGVYFFRINAGDFVKVQKMMLIK
ncbi:MAG: T9SS type A sorting domain-containing protein [Ignavibacteriae bacterium]|nr:T9SS type A sorting domain-containing protein [Ignavibacteriota bacterium]MCB9243609.1 T9SS type A sorting domain-containing protein [Ignavibacteriales bacterium]